eukprot:Gb_19545 [translate_table: standard]
MVVIKELSLKNHNPHPHPQLKKGITPRKGRKSSDEGEEIEDNDSLVVEEIVKMERRIFPKHESLAHSFYQDLNKRNCGLLYALCPAGESTSSADKNLVGGYVMYSWPSCLLGSINKLAVRESCRRQGYGEALLRAAIEKCKTRNIQRLSLHVDPLRIEALSLYRKLGFRIDTLLHSYYCEGRHAYRMFLDFHQD